MRRSLGIVLSVGVAAALAVSTPAAALGEPDDGLAAAVQAKIGGKARWQVSQTGTDVNVMRRDGADWAFGAGIATAPPVDGAYPDGWLFVAHKENKVWTVAFEDEATFAKLAAAAPATVVPGNEKQIFASYGAPVPVATDTAKPLAGGDFRTGMRLPWAIGQSWTLTGGPHESALQAVDLAGGDGHVLAARGGTLFVMCSSQKGWLRVAHDRGYSTDYYHLFNNRTDNGATVAEGAFLGNIGTDVSCGGSATGPHVHFSLRQNGAYVESPRTASANGRSTTDRRRTTVSRCTARRRSVFAGSCSTTAHSASPRASWTPTAAGCSTGGPDRARTSRSSAPCRMGTR
jgi:LasA protease